MLKLSTPTVDGRVGRQISWRGIIRHGVVPTRLGFASEKRTLLAEHHHILSRLDEVVIRSAAEPLVTGGSQVNSVRWTGAPNSKTVGSTPAGTFANMPVGTPHSFTNESRRPATMLISVAPAGQNGHPSARTPTRLWLRLTVPPSALSLSRSAPTGAELPTTTLKLSVNAPALNADFRGPKNN
jgi:hypothetical protein